MPAPRPEQETRDLIDAKLNLIVLHAGDAQEIAAHTQGLVAQDTMTTADVYKVDEHLADVVTKLNASIRALNDAKHLLRSTGAS